MADDVKHAAAGSMMLRRADVRALFFKLKRRYLDALRAAEDEGNEEWRYSALRKLRLLKEIDTRLYEECPVFVNPARAELAEVKEWEVPVREPAA